MRFSIFLFASLCVFAAVIAAVPLPQDQEDVRGAFLTSRPKEKTAPSTVRTRPKPVPSPTPRRSPTPADPNRQNTKPKDVIKPAKINTQRIGIGLTLFSRDTNGLAVRLDQAGNYIRSHVPFEIPSSLAAEERLRWLVFDEHGGDERLYFVFSHEPLAGVPIEDDLISYCRDANPACRWHPATEVWNQIKSQMDQLLQTDKSERYGKAQTDV